jgi:manganese transport system permease protein
VTLLDWFVEPLQYEFMVRAILVSAFVGLVCAVLSCYMVLKRWSLMGDAVSHSVLPGVVLAYIVGLPFGIGAFTAGLASVVLMSFVKARSKIKEDAVIGIVFTGFFALGIVLISRTPSNVDLSHVLFGNVLGISDSDMIQTVVLGTVTLIGIAVLRKDILLFCFDPIQARSLGINIRRLEYTLLVLLSLTVVAALQTVGIVLVVAMLVTPGSIGFLLSERFNRMVVIAVVASVGSSVLGAYLSYHLDISTGGAIVCLQALVFLGAFFLAPRSGVLPRLLRRDSERAAAAAPRSASAPAAVVRRES